MRFMIKAKMDTEKANAAAKAGKLGQIIGAIVEAQKPEAAYFIAEDGKRTAVLFLNMNDTSELPAIAEPWFLAFNAELEATPAMVAEDLMKAGPDIEEAVKNFG